jgi:hypothetical protein
MQIVKKKELNWNSISSDDRINRIQLLIESLITDKDFGISARIINELFIDKKNNIRNIFSKISMIKVNSLKKLPNSIMTKRLRLS